MEDDDLIALLKRHRPQAPKPPADEWASISAAIERRAKWWRSKVYVWLLGGGLAFASMALILIKAPQHELPAEEAAGVADFLYEASSALDVKAAPLSKNAGDPYLDLLEQVDQ